jgi:succinylglutamate desuccinylase
MTKGKFQSVDAYEADVLALLDKAEKNLASNDYVDLLNNLSQSIDRKHDEVVYYISEKFMNNYA